jgi:hypothetical protein
MKRRQRIVPLKRVKELAIQKQRRCGVNMILGGTMIAIMKTSRLLNHARN